MLARVSTAQSAERNTLLALNGFIVPHSYPFNSFPNVVIGRWTVDKAFVMYSRIHHLAIIDGTGFSSYHLGEDAAEKSMDKYEERDWIYNRIIVNNTIADILGSMNTREVFCQ